MNRKSLLIVVLVFSGMVCLDQALSQDAPNPEGRQGRRGRGNFDPAQMRQRMAERMKERLGATEDEWKVLEPKVEKVMTLQRESRGGGMFMGRGGRRGGEGATTAPTSEPTSAVGKANQALTKVLDNKEAKPEEIKAALGALRDARTKSKAELEKAQKELREILTLRQEAILVSMGMLD